MEFSQTNFESETEWVLLKCWNSWHSKTDDIKVDKKHTNKPVAGIYSDIQLTSIVQQIET